MLPAINLPAIEDRLTREFYGQPTATVAKQLIGKALLHQVAGQWVGGWIVETEAYLHERDPASHSARGKTASNGSMFAEPGTLYVYPIHAKYCLNAVTMEKDHGTAVLIRAIEPIWGVSQMQTRRSQTDLKRLTRGPAMLCQAIGIDRSDDGRCMIQDSQLGIFEDFDQPQRKVKSTPRIGISKAVQRRLRFVDPQSDFLSRKYTPPSSEP